MFELVLGVLFVLCGLGGLKFKLKGYETWWKRGSLACIVLGLVFGVFSTMAVVPAGHVGVPVLFGKVKQIALSEGLNFINPLYDVVKMDCRVMKHEGQYDAASKDMQNVHVNMALNFRIVPEKAPYIYQKIGKSYGAIIIDPAAQEVLKAVTALHNAGEILKKRPIIKGEVQEALNTWLTKYFVDLREVALANISFDDAYEKAILAKQVEEQNAQKKEYLLVQERIDADIAITKAKGIGDATESRATGEAKAIKIKGDAEAYYNKVVSKSLTPILIQQQYLETWNGTLPKFLFGSENGATPLIQIPTE
jgi:regulator of protease activity HflC (stomatin/prohibitin superfamily)